MEKVNPVIFHLANTAIDKVGADRYFDFLGVPGWMNEGFHGNDAETLVEIAGRRCYRAFQTKDVSVKAQNANLTKVREDSAGYIGNILNSGHGSVLEHVSDSYAFENVSRVFTHELVRHRMGMAYSQESLRFVRPTSLRAYFPDVFKNVPHAYLSEDQSRVVSSLLGETGVKRRKVDDAVHDLFTHAFTHVEELQAVLIDILGMDAVKREFAAKKKLQSALRRINPDGMATGIICTANHRAWRNIITQRTSRHAEEEIRLVFGQVYEDLLHRYPAIYQDGHCDIVDGLIEVHFDNVKV